MLQKKTGIKRYQILPAVAAIAVLAVIVYYVGTVWRARARTPQIVQAALASGRIELRVSDLSGWQKCALIAIQDPDFYEHQGIMLPFWKSFTNTTITQAIVKRLYFNPFKPGIRKIRQTLIARYALHPLASKEDQLTLYLNLVWFANDSGGNPIFGFGSAARSFFNKPVAQLSEEQYIALVAMLDAPTLLNPLTHPRESADLVSRLKPHVNHSCGSHD